MSFTLLEFGTGGTDFSDLYALGGVVFAALLAFLAVVVQVGATRWERSSERKVRGIALQNEAFSRFYHIQWLVSELKVALEGWPRDETVGFARNVSENICDAPVKASFERITGFLDRAWPDLANVSPKQTPRLAEAFRLMEFCLENYDRIRGILRGGTSANGWTEDDHEQFWSNMDEFFTMTRNHAVKLDIYFASLHLEREMPTAGRLS